MRYGFWTPVFGGWLRNIPDEHMQPTWEYTKTLCQRAEKIGYDLTLVAELNLNDIKGTDQPALDAWSTAAALAAVTDTLELMVAVRPNFHQPALFAKAAANIDNIANGRLALNVVSSWWQEEATSYGLQFDQHDDRYGRTSEWLDVVDGLWREKTFNHQGPRYQLTNAICEPKPVRKPVVYAGGESEAAKTMIANQCDAYVMHGDTVEVIAEKIADMRARREKTGKPPMTFGMAAYAIVRDTEEEAKAEVARITTLDPNAPGFGNFDQWISGTQL
ncbi:MAG: LLM class flavin-dependent oxidoreductase, partial [Proteobacteria bacterium]|nr:LLM class flavin-dependent oxidoreductase [Pseudomonadota bacterium]